MSNVTVATLSGDKKNISQDSVAELLSALRGELITETSAGYDAARSVWNAMIDRRPALIVRCAGPADVLASVRFVARHGLRVAVRGGGHNIAGSGVCDDGVVIDLSRMRAVRVDPVARFARVEPGVTLADYDHETQAFGLATPVGINSTTGLAGLTLGGGFGWLSRKYGLTVDNLRSVDIVTADGSMRRASATENPDLFWAVRGGGGNFGVVTSFELGLHPVGPEVMAGLLVHPAKDGRATLRGYRDIVRESSDDLTVWTVLRKAPPLPFLPTEWHGKDVILFAACYAGDMAAGERELARLRQMGQPIADVIGPHPYAAWNQAFDPLLTPGARNYWKSHNFTELSDALIDVVLDFSSRLPSEHTEIFIARVGGAANRVAKDATAYPHRDAEFVMNVHGRWLEPSRDAACVAWAREFFDAAAPHATGGVYVNFIPEGDARVADAYGANLARLSKLKAKYDPSNLFRINQNVRA